VLYESFIHPITISGLPSAPIGALLILLACGEDLTSTHSSASFADRDRQKNAIISSTLPSKLKALSGPDSETAVYRGCLLALSPIMIPRWPPFSARFQLCRRRSQRRSRALPRHSGRRWPSAANRSLFNITPVIYLIFTLSRENVAMTLASLRIGRSKWLQSLSSH